jgi:hypothetical protein
MQKNCTISGKQFEISQFEKSFYERLSVPEPNLSPKERMRQRLMFRNERNLYLNKSHFSKRPLVCIYRPDCWVKVVAYNEWWSDSWSALDYGRDFNFEKPFFEQFLELSKEVPRPDKVIVNCENCDYTNLISNCKDCYLLFSSTNNEDCYYGKLFQNSKNVMDSAYIYNSELIYEGFQLEKCYDCKYLSFSKNCSECWFSEDLRGCKNVFLSYNLRNKQYVWMNKQLDKETYEKKLKQVLSDPKYFKQAIDHYQNIRQKALYKYANLVNSPGCTGDYIINSKNCQNSYDISDCEDCMYTQVGVKSKNLLDCSNNYEGSELNYQVMSTNGTYDCAFCLYIFYSNNLRYCEQCYNCQDCFGCVGLRNKRFCIFNKQYTESEYHDLKAKIIAHMQKTGEWGEFFPQELSPFAYNETLAHEYLPETEGYRFVDPIDPSDVNSVISEVPADIKDVSDDILSGYLICEKTGRPYKIFKKELEFYRRMNLPVAKICPDERYSQRLLRRPKRSLNERHCTKCQQKVLSSYCADRPEKILCESCYLGI